MEYKCIMHGNFTLYEWYGDNTDHRWNSKINIFPNPFTNAVKITFGITEDQTPVNIIITDITGRVVYQQNTIFNSGSQIMDVTLSSKASMFIAKACVGNNCTTQKLVKYETY